MNSTNKKKSSFKNIRNEKNISQKKLSDLTGISLRCIQYYEALRQPPTLVNAYKLSQILNTDIETLFPYDEITNNE